MSQANEYGSVIIEYVLVTALLAITFSVLFPTLETVSLNFISSLNSLLSIPIF